jgi:FlaA1/EpsC-like NDP-sugar epimerase
MNSHIRDGDWRCVELGLFTKHEGVYYLEDGRDVKESEITAELTGTRPSFEHTDYHLMSTADRQKLHEWNRLMTAKRAALNVAHLEQEKKDMEKKVMAERALEKLTEEERAAVEWFILSEN